MTRNYPIHARYGNRCRWAGLVLREFTKNPLAAFATWPRLQVAGLIVSAAYVALDLVGAFPNHWGWRVASIFGFFVFCFLIYAHIRTVHIERDGVRDAQIDNQHVLLALRDDTVQLKDRISSDRSGVWRISGANLLEAMEYGLLREAKYAPLRTRIDMGKAGGLPWQDIIPSVEYAAFNVFVSWMQQQDASPLIGTEDQHLAYGLNRFEELLGKRIALLQQNLGN